MSLSVGDVESSFQYCPTCSIIKCLMTHGTAKYVLYRTANLGARFQQGFWNADFGDNLRTSVNKTESEQLH
jgi:hypothetical protein